MATCIYAVTYSHLLAHGDLGKGLFGEPLQAIEYQNLSAIVTETHQNKPTSEKKHVLEFAQTVERLFRRYPLIPFRYGVVLKNQVSVVTILKQNAGLFQSWMDQFIDSEEYGLKVIHKHTDPLEMSDKAFASHKLEYEASNLSSAKKYLEEKLRHYKVEQAHQIKSKKIAESVHHAMQGSYKLSQIVYTKSHQLILDAAYLVENREVRSFINRVKSIQAERGDLEFLLTGPWPPYSFSIIEIEPD